MPDAKTTDAEAALRAMEKDERTAFVAGFICAGGDAAEVELQVESYMGCMRHHRATEADPPEPPL